MGVTVVAALEGALVVLVLLFLLAFCVYQLKPEILVRLMTRSEPRNGSQTQLEHAFRKVKQTFGCKLDDREKPVHVHCLAKNG